VREDDRGAPAGTFPAERVRDEPRTVGRPEADVGALRARGLVVATGEFGADMLVEIHNDGPVTLILDRTA